MLKKYQQHTATQERRKRVRLTKTVMITLCPSQYLLRTNALSRDISEDGICLVSPYKIDIGQTIELSIHLPEFKKPAVVVGEVVRRNETDDPQYPYLMGIQFVTIDPSVRQQLQEHMRFYKVEK